MNFQNDRYTLRFAEPSDDAGIRAIFESGSFQGGISVQYLRNPSPYASFCADGERNHIMVVIDNSNGVTAAVGGAVVRTEYVNGKEELCAYLTGLKIHFDYRKKIGFIAKAYQFLREHIADCTYCYTTILDDNAEAIALLEKPHRNMPKYHYLGHYTTYCFHGGKEILSLETNHTEGFGALMQSHFAKQSHTPVAYDCKGFGDTTFFCLREQGEIIACCFVCDQQAYKQYKLCSYGGMYRVLSKLPTKLLGYPAFPKAGHCIHYGVISYLYIRNQDPKLCSDFLRTVAAKTDFTLLLWGGFENNPLCKALDRMKTVHYGSRLYSVVWGDDHPQIPDGVLGIEAALL